MPNSLRTKISKLRYKGNITNEEYQEMIKKLDGHDAEVRADERNKTIEEMAGLIRSEDDEHSVCQFKCRYTADGLSCTRCILERAIMRMKEGDEKWLKEEKE